MTFSISQNRADFLGAAASTLCLVHCLATPFLFVAQAGLATSHPHDIHTPEWWGFIDITLLVVSLLAVIWSARKSTSSWMPLALGISWSALCFIIINEKVHLLEIPEWAVFIPSLGLVGFHLYNKYYCQCTDDGCCV